MENNLSKGLIKNYVNNVNQPENSYSFALNLTNELNSQEKTNEPGNSQIHELPLGYEIIGSITFNEKTYLFSTDDISSEIGVVENDTYTKLLNENLNFKKSHKISGTARMKNNCYLTLYFRDSLNRDMYLDVDNIDQLYTNGQFFIERMYFNKEILIPNIKDIKVLDTGGLLDLGSYSFVYELLDNNKNVIYKTEPTLPIRVYPESSKDFYKDIRGGYNIELYNEEVGGKNKTKKSVLTTIENIDTTYSYLRCSVIIYKAGDGLTPVCYTDPLLLNVNPTMDYLFTGVNNTFQTRDLDSLLIPNIKYDKSESFTQVQGRLLKANVDEKQVDFSNFQSFASKIETKYKIKEINKEDVTELGDAKNPNSAYMSYMGDEVYSVEIEYIFKDGYVSPKFHVPGVCLNKFQSFPVRNLTKAVQINTIPCKDKLGFNYEFLKIIYTLNGETKTATAPADKVIKLPFLFFFDPTVDVYNIDLYYLTKNGQQIPIPFGCANYEIVDNPNPKTIYSNNTASSITTILSSWHTDIEPWYNVNDYNTLPEKDRLKRWEVYNTASKLTYTTGNMAYYEGKNRYPNIINCKGQSIWGVDACGEPLAGRPIRHHKFPDNRLEPITEGDKVRLKGFQFSNIEYPHPDIVGHRFIVGIRDEFNRTIIDKGIVGSIIDNPNIYGGTNNPNNLSFAGFSWLNPQNYRNLKRHYAFSPKINFNKGYLNADYIKNEGEYIWTSQTLDSKYYDGPGNNASDVDYVIELKWKLYSNSLSFDDIKENYKLIDNFYLKKIHRKDLNGKDIINLSQNNDIALLTTTQDIICKNYKNLKFMSFKTLNKPFEDLFNIKGRLAHNNILTARSKKDTFDIFGGDTYINKFPINNIFIRDFKTGWLDYFILAISIAGVALVSILSVGTLTGPALAVASWAIAAGLVVGEALALAGELVEQFKNGMYKGILNDGANWNENENLSTNRSETVHYSSEIADRLWVESEINVGLRHSGTAAPYSIFTSGDPHTYFKNKILFWDDKTYSGKKVGYAPYTVSLSEYYDINRDYLVLDRFRSNMALPQTYNYCFKCRNQYPYRIIYSNKSFNEDIVDNYLNFAANNYIDIPTNKGKILSLQYREGKLFVFTELTTFILQPNPQILQTSNLDVYLGTGDLLAIPPQELIQTDLGTTGVINQYSIYNSKFGLTWITNNKEVVSYAGGLEILSGPMDSWLKNNLTANTKLSYNNLKGILYLSQKGEEKESFTLSYDYRAKNWLSFHSYLPDNFFNNINYFYTTNGHRIYQHQNEGNFNMFYGEKYPTIVEVIDVSLITQSLDAVYYLAKLSNPASNLTNIMCYTPNHNTGLLELVNIDQNENPYGNILTSDTTKTIIKTDENYKISNLYDLSISTKNISESWNDIEPYIKDYGYLDLVPINIDTNKSQYDYANIKDKWIAIRLFYKPTNQDDKLNLYYISINNQQSIR